GYNNRAPGKAAGSRSTAAAGAPRAEGGRNQGGGASKRCFSHRPAEKAVSKVTNRRPSAAATKTTNPLKPPRNRCQTVEPASGVRPTWTASLATAVVTAKTAPIRRTKPALGNEPCPNCRRISRCSTQADVARIEPTAPAPTAPKPSHLKDNGTRIMARSPLAISATAASL